MSRRARSLKAQVAVAAVRGDDAALDRARQRVVVDIGQGGEGALHRRPVVGVDGAEPAGHRVREGVIPALGLTDRALGVGEPDDVARGLQKQAAALLALLAQPAQAVRFEGGRREVAGQAQQATILQSQGVVGQAEQGEGGDDRAVRGAHGVEMGVAEAGVACRPAQAGVDLGPHRGQPEAAVALASRVLRAHHALQTGAGGRRQAWAVDPPVEFGGHATIAASGRRAPAAQRLRASRTTSREAPAAACAT